MTPQKLLLLFMWWKALLAAVPCTQGWRNMDADASVERTEVSCIIGASLLISDRNAKWTSVSHEQAWQTPVMSFSILLYPPELCSRRQSSVHCQLHTAKAGISLLLCVGALSISTAGCLGVLQPWPRIAGEQTPLGTNLNQWRRQLVINAPPPHPLVEWWWNTV